MENKAVGNNIQLKSTLGYRFTISGDFNSDGKKKN